jgi:hypothetical protein
MMAPGVVDRIVLDDVTLVGVDGVDIDRLVFAAEVCQRHLQFKAVRLFSHLPHDTAPVVPIEPITTKEQYSEFVIKELHKHFDTSHVLIIQWDGFVMNPFGWCDEFLEYDYIGAPWIRRRMGDLNVGNGGFSLRSRRLMQAIAAAPLETCHPEDAVICRRHGPSLRAQGFTFAPEELASRFSVEGAKWDGQFGFHRTDISAWDIHRFVDGERHVKHVELFQRIFFGGAER